MLVLSYLAGGNDMRKTGCLVLVCCLLLALAGCSVPPSGEGSTTGSATSTTAATEPPAGPSRPDRPIRPQEGNSALNIDSGSWAVEADGYAYFILGGKQIYRQSLSGGEVTLLLEDSRINKLDSLSIYDGWLYFTCMYFGGRMQGTTRMRTDGTGWEKIGQSTARFYLLDGVLTYEESVQESGAQYRYFVTSLDPETGDTEQLLDLGVDNRGGLIGMEDGVLYYTEAGTGALCRRTPDGTVSRVETAGREVHSPRVYDGRVYFLSGEALFAADFESGTIETVWEGAALSAFQVTAGSLLTVDAAGELMLRDSAGPNGDRQLADAAHNLNVWGDRIYYQADGDYYSVLSDGTDRREIRWAE